MTIKEFFNKLNSDINNSKTDMSLKILETRARNFAKDVIENDMISKVIKSEAKRNLNYYYNHLDPLYPLPHNFSSMF